MIAPAAPPTPARTPPRAPGPTPRAPVPTPAAALLLLVLPGFLAACGDLGPLDDVSLDADEPVPALRFGGELPSLPALVRRWAPADGLGPAVEQWEVSWSRPEEEGVRERVAANRAAAPSLLEAMPPGETLRLARKVDDVFAALDELAGRGLPAGIEGPLSDARDAREEARLRGERGEEALQLAHLLETTDHLRRTTPGAMARVLVSGVEEELRRNSGVPSYSEERRTRIERLLAGAREALATDEPALALRRAWYAAGLLEDAPPPPGHAVPDPDAAPPFP